MSSQQQPFIVPRSSSYSLEAEDEIPSVLNSLSRLLKWTGLLEENDIADDEWDSEYLRQLVSNSPGSSRKPFLKTTTEDWASIEFDAPISKRYLLSEAFKSTPATMHTNKDRAEIKLEAISPESVLPSMNNKATPETMASTVLEDNSPNSHISMNIELEDRVTPGTITLATDRAPIFESVPLESAYSKIASFDDGGNIEVVLGSPHNPQTEHIEIAIVPQSPLEQELPTPAGSDDDLDSCADIVTDSDDSNTEDDADMEAVIAQIDAEFGGNMDTGIDVAKMDAHIDAIIENGIDASADIYASIDPDIYIDADRETDSQTDDDGAFDIETRVDAKVGMNVDNATADVHVGAQSSAGVAIHSEIIALNEMDLQTADGIAQTDTLRQPDASVAHIDPDITQPDAILFSQDELEILYGVAETDPLAQPDASVAYTDPGVSQPDAIAAQPCVDVNSIMTPKRVLFPIEYSENSNNEIEKRKSEEPMANETSTKEVLETERSPAKLSQPEPNRNPEQQPPRRLPTATSVRRVLVITAINTVINYVVLNVGMHCLGIGSTSRQIASSNQHRISAPKDI